MYIYFSLFSAYVCTFVTSDKYIRRISFVMGNIPVTRRLMRRFRNTDKIIHTHIYIPTMQVDKE